MMDPPRQVSRRGPGSGPVFRTFKKQPTSASSSSHHSVAPASLQSNRIATLPLCVTEVPPLSDKGNCMPFTLPKPVDDVATLIHLPTKRHRTIPELGSIVNTKDSTRIALRRNSPKKDRDEEVILDPRTRGNRGIRTSGTHKIEEADVWASTVIAKSLQKNASPDCTKDKSAAQRLKKLKQGQVRRQQEKLRRLSAASDKVSLAVISENPTMDSLWALAAEDWKDPSEDDSKLLKSIMSENLAGCLEFVKHDYSVFPSASGEPISVERKPSCDVIGHEAAKSGRCLPPSALFNCMNKRFKRNDMEPNDLLFLLTQAGGVDEGVWYQLQRMHDLNRCMDGSQTQCPTAASSSSRYSNSDDSLLRNFSSSTELDTIFDSANTQSQSAVSIESGRCHKTGQETAATRANSRHGKSSESTALSTALSDGNDAALSSSSLGRNVRCTANSMTEAVTAADSLMLNHLTDCLNTPSDEFGWAVLKCSSSDNNKATGAYTSCAVAEGGHGLRKRLVRYADVWDEEDFIFKTNQEHSLTALDDWSTLVRSYSDTHDGMYRDWNIQHLRKLSSAAKRDMNTMKKPSHPGKLTSDTEVTTEIFSIGFDIRAPPVPVSMIHPSCWGLNARRVAQETSALLASKNDTTDSNITVGKFHKVFDVIHPAALSVAVVEVPGTAAERDGMSDIDDFTLHAEVLVREMHALEAANYMRLKTLSSSLITASNIEDIRKKRIRLADTLTLMYQRNEYENLTSERLTYGTVPAPLWAPSKDLKCPDTATAFAACISTDAVRKVQGDSLNEGESDISEPAVTVSKQTRYGTRCAASTASTAAPALPPVKEEAERYQLGSCLLHHTPHGGYVSGLSKGDPVEHFRDGEWTAGHVLALRSDDYLLRMVKVGPLGGAIGDHVWVWVEDGRIAPPGTHLNSAIFRWMFPTIHVSAPRVISTTSSAPTAVDLTVWEDEILMLPENQKEVSSSSVMKMEEQVIKKKSNSETSKKKKKIFKKKLKIKHKGDGSKTGTAASMKARARFLKGTKSNIGDTEEEEDVDAHEREPSVQLKTRISLWNTETQSRLNGIHAPRPEDVDNFLAARPQYCLYNIDVHSLAARRHAKEEELKTCTKTKRVKQLSSGSYWNADPIIADPVLPLNEISISAAAIHEGPAGNAETIFPAVPTVTAVQDVTAVLPAVTAPSAVPTATILHAVLAVTAAVPDVAAALPAVTVVPAAVLPVTDSEAAVSSNPSPSPSRHTVNNAPHCESPKEYLGYPTGVTASAKIAETLEQSPCISASVDGHDSVQEMPDCAAPSECGPVDDTNTAPLSPPSLPAADDLLQEVAEIVVLAPIVSRANILKKKRPILRLSDCPGYGGKRSRVSDVKSEAETSMIDTSKAVLTVEHEKSFTEEAVKVLSILPETLPCTIVVTEATCDAAVAPFYLLKQDIDIESSSLEESSKHDSSQGKCSSGTVQSTAAATPEDTSEDAISDATTSVAYSDFNAGDANPHNSHEQHNRSASRQIDLLDIHDMQSSRWKRRRDRDCTDGRGCETNPIHRHSNYASPESGKKRAVDSRWPGSGDRSSERGSARRRSRSREWVKDHEHDDSSTDHSRSRSRSRSEETNDGAYREEDSASSSDQYSSMPRIQSSREAGNDAARGCSGEGNNDNGDITSGDRGRSRDKERERDRDRKWLRVRDSDRLADEFRDLSSSDDTSPSLSDSGSPKKSNVN